MDLHCKKLYINARYDRLKSISFDAKFISDLSDLIPFPCVPNERCGSWYLENIENSNERVYFKSTDGHHGKWSFNRRRMNLSILPLILEHNGIMIIDSTQKGKKIPDALSKTIPIWCCVLNQYIMLSDDNKKCTFDGNFYSPPGVISKSEHDQIFEIIPDFVKGLQDIKLDSEWLFKLNKPLRPIWITPHSTIIEDWNDFPFYPIVCVTASGNHVSNTFKYVKGAADDHESWANVRNVFMIERD